MTCDGRVRVACWAAWAALAIVMAGALCAPAAGDVMSSKETQFYSLRQGLDDSRHVFTDSGRGRVAYLGGSITCAPGWRVWTSRAIQERFPDTQFEFINAGIGGTNSTFGAFRLGRDVLGDGPVDLLFVEFAANDSYDRGPDNRRARAMEGIVRQARRLNPKTDIVFIYLLDKRKFEMLNAGEIPEPIQDHESVAHHCDLPSVNLASVVTARLNAGDYVWEDLFGDSCHTTPRGGEVYGAFVREFLDVAWSEQAAAAAPRDHALFDPLDRANYEQAKFVDLGQARLVEGWRRLRFWNAPKKINYSGTLDVLAAETPGATLEFEFDGTACGIAAISGMDAGIIECSVDGQFSREIDLMTSFSVQGHLPVFHLLAEELEPGCHTLRITVSERHSEKSVGTAARITHFAVNGTGGLGIPIRATASARESVIRLLDPEWPGLAQVFGKDDPPASLEALLAYYRGRFPLRDYGEFLRAEPRVHGLAGCGESGSASMRLWRLTRAWEATRREEVGEALLAAVHSEFVADGNALRPTRVVDFCERYPTLVHVPGFEANDLGLILNRVDVIGRRLMDAAALPRGRMDVLVALALTELAAVFPEHCDSRRWLDEGMRRARYGLLVLPPEERLRELDHADRIWDIMRGFNIQVPGDFREVVTGLYATGDGTE